MFPNLDPGLLGQLLAGLSYGVHAWLFVNSSGRWVPIMYLYPNALEVQTLPASLKALRDTFGATNVTYVTDPKLPFAL